ncbi:MAG: putative colanic acid biosynthesis acetyltransferase [Bacteroidia bacterium]|nr:putative colanic acid biosynthesis acetyltransferase [Bacteroidia bacterium]
MSQHHNIRSDLSTFDNSWYQPGGSRVKRGLWYFTNILFFLNPWNPFSGLKCRLLRAFGANIGVGVIIKPSVNIKYPWRLHVGDHCWIGENVWIDNLAEVRIGNHVCLSQGAMLLTGNHNYKIPSFDLMLGAITLEDGSWIGAQSVVCPGVTISSHAILAVGSVATKDLDPYIIYQGNPAVAVRTRDMTDQ